MKRIEAPDSNGARLRYFVVTHRSIVEAEDETNAARLTAGKISGAREFAFEVEAEGMAAKRVVVPAIGQTPQISQASEPARHSPAAPEGDSEAATQSRQASRREYPEDVDPRSHARPAARAWISRGAAVALAISLVCLILSIALHYG